MRLFMAAARWLSLLLVPLTVSALGLGDITVNSSLNQPFSAEIPLESLETTALTELTVELASVETFRRYGLDRPAYLNDIRFNVEERPGGTPVIRLTSMKPLSEPFVTLLLDVRWPSGRLLREYTALLDPPLFEGAKVAAPVKPAQAAPETSSATATAGSVPRPAAVVPPAESNVVESTGLFQEPRNEAAVQPAAPKQSAPRDEPVVRDEPATVPGPAVASAAADAYTAVSGDTLWGIAQRVRGGTGIDTNQMMLALYRANPEAFMGNINALKAGAILRIPATDSTSILSASEASAEVRQQNTAWGGGTRRPSRQAQANLRLVAPSADDGAGQASSSPEAGGAGASTTAADAGQLPARIKELEQQLDESKRLLSLRDSELQSLQQRIAELEKSGDVAAEIPVQEEPVAEAPSVAQEPVAEEPAAIAEPEPTAEAPAVAEEPAADVSTPADEAAVDDAVDDSGASEPGSLLGNIWLWAVGAAVLLLAAFVIRQRRTAAAAGGTSDRWSTQRDKIDHSDTLKDFSDLPSNQDSIVVEESAFAATDAPVEDAGVGVFDDAGEKSLRSDSSAFAADNFSFDGFDQASADIGVQDAAGQDEVELPLEKTISTGAPLNLDQADPVAEAEFHMAYGLYDQAADLLTRALKNDPENRAYRLKLIEVFFVWENKDGFMEQARILKAGGVGRLDSEWNKVLILGKQLCPSDPLFSGVASSPAADSMDLELSDAGETSIDFSVDSGDAGAVDLGFDSTTGSELDLDLSSSFSGSARDDESTRNISSTRPTDSSGAAANDLDSSSLDFDIGGSDDAPTMESPTLDVMGAGSPTVAVDFNLDDGETLESPTLAGPANEPTLESPTLDALGAGAETSEMPSISKSGIKGLFDSDPPTDPTGLDIDLSGLADLPLDSDDFASMDSGAENGRADSSSPVFGDDKKRLSPETENIYVSSEDATIFASLEQLGKVAGDTHESPPDAVASDTLQQPQLSDEVNDTAEQPGISDSGDLSADFDDFVMSEEVQFADDATMTEVGTKLDLARAYIDMGDPDGARSILEEVLDEGGETQQQQARQLLNELND